MRRSPSKGVSWRARRPIERRSGGKPHTAGRRRKTPRVRSSIATLSIAPSARCTRAIPSWSLRSSPRSRSKARTSVRMVIARGESDANIERPGFADVASWAVAPRLAAARESPTRRCLTPHFGIIDQLPSGVAQRREQGVGGFRSFEPQSVLDPVYTIRLVDDAAKAHALRARVQHRLDERAQARDVRGPEPQQGVRILSQ